MPTTDTAAKPREIDRVTADEYLGRYKDILVEEILNAVVTADEYMEHYLDMLAMDGVPTPQAVIDEISRHVHVIEPFLSPVDREVGFAAIACSILMCSGLVEGVDLPTA